MRIEEGPSLDSRSFLGRFHSLTMNRTARYQVGPCHASGLPMSISRKKQIPRSKGSHASAVI
jgi:hypothetical protein